MSNAVVAFMLGIGAATWIYNKLMGSTGGNTKNSMVAAGSLGALAFIVMLMIMNTINKT